MMFLTFIMSPMRDDFLYWKGMPGDAVYGRKMDLCWVNDMENTDSVDIWNKYG